MSTDDLETKLTPAGRRTLDEIVDDYKNEILQAAGTSASRPTGEVREISVHDILQGSRRIRSPLSMIRNSLIDRLAIIYAFLGLGGLVVGWILYFAETHEVNFLTKQQLPILISIGSSALAAASVVLAYLARTSLFKAEGENIADRDDRDELLSAYMGLWREVELSIRNLASARLGETVAQEPISYLIEKLGDTDMLSKDDAKILQSLLRLRNQLAHGSEPANVPRLSRSIQDARLVLRKINGLRLRATN